MTVLAPSRIVAVAKWREGAATAAERSIPEETPVAITFNRVTHAVMMATPDDLEDFATGFSLAEEIVTDPAEIESFERVEAELGLELRLWIPAHRMVRLEERRRRLAGATGCGMCGLESLDEAARPVAPVPDGRAYDAGAIARAVASLPAAQRLNQATRAVHAAGFWTERDGLIALREDVGRHNALDKLAGHLARNRIDAADGILVLTSRISIELVQKAARMGAPILVAVSAPTAHALRIADRAGMTIAGIAREDGFEVFTHPRRVDGRA